MGRKISKKEIAEVVQVITGGYKPELGYGSAGLQKLRAAAIADRIITYKKASDAGDRAAIRRALEDPTDAEILMILMDASLKAPPSSRAYEEQKRLFKIYFPEKGEEIFGNENVDLDKCREFRRVAGLPGIKEEGGVG